MKITASAIQVCSRDGDITNNLIKLECLIREAAKMGSKLIVLPEICDIGYNLETIKKLAESFPNNSTKKFSELASELKVTIVAGLAECRGGDIFNTATVFDTNGKIAAKYDKTHLCPFLSVDEPLVFKPGSSIFTVNIQRVKIGITICYDIRFPEIYRKLAFQGAQIIVHPDAFPRKRIDQLEICLRARAIENQIFMVTANHCQTTGKIEFGGRSMIVGPMGDIMAGTNETDEQIVTATIDLDDIERLRKEYPVINNRHPELYA